MHQSVPASLRRLSGDRRGATAIVFALGATALFGLVGLATEGGSWYLAKRAAQNAADTGALAGAIASATSGTTTATIKTVASAVATKNVGLNAVTSVATSRVTVTPNVPPTSGAYAGNGNAIEVIVDVVPQVMFAKLPPFNIASVTIQGRAVALIKNPAPACVISLQGDLTIGGNNSVTAPSCAFVSNAVDSTAVNINGNPQPNIGVVDIPLGASCSGCSSLSPPLPTFTMPLPVTNPFSSLDSTTFPSSSCTSVTVGANTTLVPGTVYCSLDISNGNVATMPQGTYFFTGNVKITGGSLTSGTGGVNIVMLGGTSAGTWTTNGGTVNLTAQMTNSAYPSLDGVLLYDPSQSNSSLGGNSGDVFSGGLYFPNSQVTWAGNGASGYNCTELVANTVKMTGSAATNFATTGCSALGTPVPETQVAALVE